MRSWRSSSSPGAISRGLAFRIENRFSLGLEGDWPRSGIVGAAAEIRTANASRQRLRGKRVGLMVKLLTGTRAFWVGHSGTVTAFGRDGSHVIVADSTASELGRSLPRGRGRREQTRCRARGPRAL